MILVVEDDQLIQGVIEEALTDGGFETTIASSGEEAIGLLDAANPEFRALVTDINLGKDTRDGWAVARHARQIAGFADRLHDRRQRGRMAFEGSSQ